MRKIAATYILTGNQPPIRNGVLVCEDDGTIINIIEKGDKLNEEAGLEFYSGVLVPGFVNAHCHLEFSHTKGQIEEKTGIAGFIKKINQLRTSTDEEMQKAMQVADRKMWAAGIAAVGDVSNSVLSAQVKLKSALLYHTFVEVFDFHPSRADRAFQIALDVKEGMHKRGLSTSIVPHSPYSVSEPLFQKIKENAVKTGGILSIHNQESKGESEFYHKGTGPIAGHFQNNLGLDISHWKATGKSSLQSILQYLPAENKLLLVHNTYTSEDDIEFLLENRAHQNTFLVLCPNSNLYIENALPPLDLFQKYNLKICLGTDSLASNHQLSVLSEMITLQTRFPEITLQELLDFACLNGAEALGFGDQLGSFEIGKKPGVNLLTKLDLKELKLTKDTQVKRLL